jgi:hypothetical protein
MQLCVVCVVDFCCPRGVGCHYDTVIRAMVRMAVPRYGWTQVTSRRIRNRRGGVLRKLLFMVGCPERSKVAWRLKFFILFYFRRD